MATTNPRSGKRNLRDVTNTRQAFVHRATSGIEDLVSDIPEEVLQAILVGKDVTLRSFERAGNEAEEGVPPRLDDARLALLLRAFRATCSAVKDISADALVAALASPTDHGALVRTLSGIPVPEATAQEDPFAGAVARSVAHRQLLLERAGEILSSNRVAYLLGISRQAVDKRRKAGRLLALRRASDWAYPALQFQDGETMTLLEQVLLAHREMDPWAILDLLLAEDAALGGRSLLDAIRQGDEAVVKRYLAQAEADGFA